MGWAKQQLRAISWRVYYWDWKTIVFLAVMSFVALQFRSCACADKASWHTEWHHENCR